MQQNNITTTTQKVQIVDDNGNYILPKQYSEMLTQLPQKLINEYRIVSIVGAQSTGKSTYMNHVFGTDFQVLEDGEGLKQTTKGVWGALIEKPKIMVFDVEGVDSAERWDQGAFMERSTSLFSLVMSNVMIINMWTHDARRFTGSNLKLLQTIFEMNFKLFYDKKKPKERKNLVIVLRDYLSKYNFKSITEAVINDLHKIWKEIAKPSEFRHSSLDVFFDVNFETMPHFEFQFEQFKTAADEQYKKFIDPSAQGYFFKDISTKPVVPLDSLSIYIYNIWKTIRECKDIDIPSQRHLVSEHRCNQIRNEILKTISIPKITNINKKMKGIYPELANESDALYEESVNLFNTKTEYYIEEIVDRHRSEMEHLITESLNKLLQKQLKFISIYLNRRVADKFKDLDEVAIKYRNSFAKNWNKFKKSILSESTEMLEFSTIKCIKFDMKNHIDEVVADIEQRFDDYRAKTLDDFRQNYFQDHMENELNQKINDLFDDHKSHFWVELNIYLQGFWGPKFKDYSQGLVSGYEISKEEAEKATSDLKNQNDNFIINKIQGMKPYFKEYLMAIFTENFEKANGKERDWTLHTKSEVEQYYNEAVKFCNRVIDSFQNLEIIDQFKTTESLTTVEVEEPEYRSLFTGVDIEEQKAYFELNAQSRLKVAIIQAENGSGFMNNMIKNLKLARFIYN